MNNQANKLNQKEKKMSRMSDAQLVATDLQTKYYVQFMDWLYDNIINAKITSDEIDLMEIDFENNKRDLENTTSNNISKPQITVDGMISNPANNVAYKAYKQN